MFRVYITFLALLITLVCPTPAQVFSVTPDAPNGSQPQNRQAPSAGQQLGWGSNIQNARLARAAELALEHGDRTLAVDYAQRAAQAAPGDPQLWFLLGYTARIDARFELSAEAYQARSSSESGVARGTFRSGTDLQCDGQKRRGRADPETLAGPQPVAQRGCGVARRALHEVGRLHQRARVVGQSGALCARLAIGVADGAHVSTPEADGSCSPLSRLGQTPRPGRSRCAEIAGRVLSRSWRLSASDRGPYLHHRPYSGRQG